MQSTEQIQTEEQERTLDEVRREHKAGVVVIEHDRLVEDRGEG